MNRKRNREKTFEERYTETLLNLCQTELLLLKNRVGHLEELPIEDRVRFQDFCDCAALCFYSFLKGQPEKAALDEFMARFSKDSTIKEISTPARINGGTMAH